MNTSTEDQVYRSRVRGCLLGGAIGDALGGPVEFWSSARIVRELGDRGVTEYLAEEENGETVYGRITDDTQMTLFTIEGMIRASVRTDRGLGFTIGVLHHAYDRWLDTQQLPAPDGTRDGWLIGQQWLYARRAPGTTCLTALTAARGGARTPSSYGALASNDSKGCGGVMRSAPFGLVPPSSRLTTAWQFEMAATAAAFTHGHVTGQLASGALAVLIGAILRGDELLDAIQCALSELRKHEGHGETVRVLERAIEAAQQPPSIEILESLGGGWIAEEALAIAVYAALVYPGADDMLDALALAVTHSGDSDSTGAICGNILGALHGEAALPPQLVFEVEGRGTILELADDFIAEFTASHHLHGDYGPDTRWRARYPGW